MTHTIRIVVSMLSDGSEVFAVRITNQLGEVITIDAIAEDDARNMAERFQSTIRAYGNDDAAIAFADARA